MERQNIGMLKPREQPDLADEAELAGLGTRIGVQYLERDSAFVPRVTGEIDSCECTLPDLALYLVSPSERGAKGSERILRDGRSSQISLQPGISLPVL